MSDSVMSLEPQEGTRPGEDPGVALTAAKYLALLRVGLGAGALVVPEPAGRVWVGPHARGRAGRVLLRALGGRDLALGLGALLAATRAQGGPIDRQDLRRWLAMGALSDTVDTLATAVGYRDLPRFRRALVLVASGGAALSGAYLFRALDEKGGSASP